MAAGDAGRPIAAANYWTNDVARPATPPESGADVLVSRTLYNARGEGFETVDPAGMVSRVARDAAGRVVETIQNYQPAGAAGGGTDENVTVRTTYTADGQVATLTAVNPLTGDQTTRYVYGTTLADSAIARADLLVAEQYPDAADATDCVHYTYNRQGERTKLTDQNGTKRPRDGAEPAAKPAP